MKNKDTINFGKCPHCQEVIEMNITAALAEKQTITMTLESTADHIPARVLGDSINHMQRLLKEVAKGLGGKVEVFIVDMRKKGRKYEIEYLTIEIKSPKKKP